jgi:hypothetical protein
MKTPLMVCSAHANQQGSILLRFPAEIRNLIYDIIFETAVSDTDCHHLQNDCLNWDRLQFSQTCCQIYAETARAYFVKKILPFRSTTRFSSIAELAAEPPRLTPSQRRALCSVEPP